MEQIIHIAFLSQILYHFHHYVDVILKYFVFYHISHFYDFDTIYFLFFLVLFVLFDFFDFFSHLFEFQVEEIVKEMAQNNMYLSVISTRPLKKLSDLYEIQHPFFSKKSDSVPQSTIKSDIATPSNDSQGDGEKVPSEVLDISKDPSKKMTAMMRGIMLGQTHPSKRPRLEGIYEREMEKISAILNILLLCVHICEILFLFIHFHSH